MNELGQVLTQMAILPYRYNTIRGKWSDMPDSTWLCVILGIVSTAACTFSIYVEYGLQTAMGIPVAWLAGLADHRRHLEVKQASFIGHVPIDHPAAMPDFTGRQWAWVHRGNRGNVCIRQHAAT
jgi:hypothetical protein